MTEGTGRDGNGDRAGGQMQTVPYLAAPTAPDPAWQPPAPPPLPPQAPTPPPIQPARSRVRRGLFRLVLLLSVLVLAAGAVYAVLTWQNQSQPGTVAADYLAAVARDDAPAALSYGTMPAGPQALLTTDALRRQLAIASMTGITVVAVDQSGHDAVVSVVYQLNFASGAVRVNDKIRLVRSGHTWRLASVAIPLTLRLSKASARAELAGAQVPADSQLYFPGALPLTFDTPNLVAASQDQVVKFTGPSSLDVAVQVSAAGRVAVWTALNTALRACLAGTFAAPATCPQPGVAGTVPGSLRGTTTYNTSAPMDLPVLDGPEGIVQVSSEAPINGTYSKLDFNNLPQTTPFNSRLAFSAFVSAKQPSTVVWSIP